MPTACAPFRPRAAQLLHHGLTNNQRLSRYQIEHATLSWQAAFESSSPVARKAGGDEPTGPPEPARGQEAAARCLEARLDKINDAFH